MSGTDKKTLLARAATQEWFHRIRLYEDYETKGQDDTPHKLAHLDAIGLPADLTGKRVLDIGAWDGFFSFECERRGAAEVVALDHVAAHDTGFCIASAALDSSVIWCRKNLYDVTPEEIGQFDIVLCLGVIYHLRHILLGLDRIRGVMKEGGDLFVETASIDNHAWLNGGTFGPLAPAAPGVCAAPLLQIYPGAELNGDPTNVFAPNEAGLHALIKAAEFEVLTTRSGYEGFPTRAMAHARAISDPGMAFFRTRDATVLTKRKDH